MSVLNVFDTVSAANNGAELHLLHPATKLPVYADEKETKPLIINILGVDSDIFEREAVKIQRRESRNKSKEVDTEKAKRDACDLYAKLTTGWKNIPNGDGKGDLPFSYENAFNLYMQYKDIRVQVGNSIGDQQLFIVD